MKVKLTELVPIFIEATGSTKAALFKQVRTGKFKSAERIGNQWYIDKDEFYESLPIDKNGQPMKTAWKLSQEWGINHKTFLKYLNDNNIPVKKIGSKTYVTPSDLKPLLDMRDKANSPEYIALQDYAKIRKLNGNNLTIYAEKGKIPSAFKYLNKWYVRKDDEYLRGFISAEIPDGYVVVTEYASKRNMDLQTVRNSVNMGQFKNAIKTDVRGQKISWFLDEEEEAMTADKREAEFLEKGRYLNAVQIAEKCNLSPITIRQLLRRGDFKTAVKVGRKWFVEESEIEDALKRKKEKNSKKVVDFLIFL